MKLNKIICTIYHHDKILHEYPQTKHVIIYNKCRQLAFTSNLDYFSPSNKMELTLKLQGTFLKIL